MRWDVWKNAESYARPIPGFFQPSQRRTILYVEELQKKDFNFEFQLWLRIILGAKYLQLVRIFDQGNVQSTI